MPSLATLVVFTGAAVLVLLIPGPAVLYILARSAGEGTRAGLVSVAGIHTGTAVHILAAALGLSAVLVASASAFTAVKLAGAAYLVLLGVRMLRAPDAPTDSGELPPRPSRSLRRTYVDGAVVNLLNPKVAVFFLAFVPQFVDPTRGGAPTQIVVLGVWFMLLGLVSDAGYAVGGAWIGRRLRRTEALPRRARLVAGTTYIGLGVATALSGGLKPALSTPQ
jgi:threonine/homoserine/homoserine lactone efflux protein